MENAAEGNTQMETLISRHSFPEDLEKSSQMTRREEHEKRLKSLKKELNFIDETAWQFESIEKLTGHP